MTRPLILQGQLRHLPYYIVCLWAACVLTGCDNGRQRRLQLEQLEAQNRAGEQLLNDSLAEDLVEYFDRHGDANERMRAKYMLGRTYYHLGELPRALETYFEAADCADTTDKNCDYKVLCRVYAQKGAIYHNQVQPRSQIEELITARYYAEKAKDTLVAVECYAQLTEAYKYLKKFDSAIIVAENASIMFESIGRKDRAAQILGSIITLFVDKGRVSEAKQILESYETKTGFFDQYGNIQSGREIYYYVKGRYYLSVNELDSAEMEFRKGLKKGKDLNNQIAGCKGLQMLFKKRGITDSVAKYSDLCYELNDSAYSLSEMQNIQRLHASYNYNHHKYLAKQKESEAKIAWLISILIVLVSAILLRFFFKRYRNFKRAALDHRLRNADITRKFHKMAKSQPIQYPSLEDWADLRLLVEHEIPLFKSIVNSGEDHPLSDMDYDVCIAIRVNLTPIEISKLKQCSPSTVTKVRKRLLLSVFGREGTADDFDDEIAQIGIS